MDYILDGKIDRGGVMTDKRTREYAAEHNVNYAEALRTVVKQANQSHAEKINRATARYQHEHGNADGWRVYEENGDVIELQLDAAGPGITKLGNIVCGLPRLPDHSIDIPLVLRVIRSEFSEVGKEAAGGFLHHIAMKILGSAKPHEGMDLVSALRVAQQRFPEVARVWDGGQISEAALRIINAPLFKTPTPQGAPMGERAYARPSVKSYVNGNEYRRYVLDAK